MRRGFIKSVLLMIIIFLSNGCYQQLDLPNDGRISMEEVFSDYNRTRGYLNSCYGYAPPPYIDRSSFSDEAQDADDITPNSGFSMWYSGSVTAESFVSVSPDENPWGVLYQGIRKCNVFLSNIEQATLHVSDEEKSGWIAQARTLRALYYLQLIKRFGGVPILNNPLEIGYDFSNDRRASFSEVVKFILDDCDAALNVKATRNGFPWEIYDHQFGKMTRAVAYAIKSQAILYAVSPLWNDGTFSWDDATRITAEALSHCLANDYKLFDVKPANNIAQNSYALYFITSSNDQRAVDKETIYQLGNQMEIWRWAGLPTNPGMERSGPGPTQDLIDAYEMENGEPIILGYGDSDRLSPIVNPASGYDENNPYAGRDPRFYASVYYNGAPKRLDVSNSTIETYVGGAEGISATDRRHTRTGYYVRKYNNYQSGLNNSSDGAVRLFRLAELYLNFAEAAYQSSEPDNLISYSGLNMSARDAVNAIRRRANMPDLPSGMSREEFEKRYRNERRVELAFEEHRYFDVRRWRILNQTDKFVTGMRIQNDGGKMIYNRFRFKDRESSSDKFLQYPLPQSEVNKMFELTGQNWQNPGWVD